MMQKLQCNSLISFIMLAMVLTPFHEKVKTQTGSPAIDLSKYNSISNTIDSLNYLIDKENQEVLLISNDIKKLKTSRINLSKECSSIQKESLGISKDSLKKSNTNCDSLTHLLKILDKKIKDDSAEIGKYNKSIRKNKEKVALNTTQLNNESELIISAAKNCNGSLHFVFKGINYNVFIANTMSNEIKMYWQNKNKRNYASIGKLLDHLKEQKIAPLMITNAGMYSPTLQPQGLFIEQYELLKPLDLRSPKTDANFYLKPNGVYFIDSLRVSHIKTSEDFQKIVESKNVVVKYATQSGPMLLTDGKIHPSFTRQSNNKKIRSGVGIINENLTVFAISLGETNFYDFALLFKDIFGCKDALFLDGAISKMYLDIAPKELGGKFGALISVLPKKETHSKLDKKR